jgi:hypothetical protein
VGRGAWWGGVIERSIAKPAAAFLELDKEFGAGHPVEVEVWLRAAESLLALLEGVQWEGLSAQAALRIEEMSMQAQEENLIN